MPTIVLLEKFLLRSLSFQNGRVPYTEDEEMRFLRDQLVWNTYSRHMSQDLVSVIFSSCCLPLKPAVPSRSRHKSEVGGK